MRRVWVAPLLLAASCSRSVEPITDCPSTSLLVDGICRVRCESTATCLTGEVCEGTPGVCRRGSSDAGAGYVLRFNPGTLGFGPVPVGTPLDGTVVLINDGPDADAIELLVEGTSAFTVAGPEAQPFELPAGTSAPLTVTFLPSAAGPISGTLVARGCGGDCTTSMTLTGEGSGPATLRCEPAAIDLGIPPLDRATKATLACVNEGAAAVRIDDLAFRPDVLELEVTSDPRVGEEVASGGRLEIEVTWTPRSRAPLSTTLELVAGASKVQVPITGNAPRCVLAPLGATFEFGVTPAGRNHEASIPVRNTGTAPCTPTAELTGMGAAELAVTQAPATIEPGQLVFFDVRYNPVAPQLSAQLTLRSPEADATVVELTGVAGNPLLRTASTELRWGQIQSGCRQGNDRTIDLVNASNVGIVLDTVELVEYEPTFFTTARNSGSVAATDRLRVTIEARPAISGPQRGRLRLVSGPIVQYVELFANASPTVDSTSDRRSPDAVDAIDVLFVIDGDLRTGQVAQRLAGATARFFERLGNTNTNYRVGVVHAQGLAGIGRANLVGQPTVISPTTPSPAAALAARLTAPGVTLGRAPLLEVAREATTVPARTSGPNAGFLRLDGQLEVIVVTVRDDEDDDTVSSTLEALGDRPLGRPRAIRVHAISGGPNGCGSGAGADLADPTERLARAVALTGGVEISACAEDFATALSDLAGALRQPHAAVLQLSSRPVAGTVVIANPPVGGAEWSVDHQRARVVYDPHPAAQPVGNVVVQWRPWCVASTCGDGRVDPGEMCDDDNRRDTDACVTTCHAAACGDGATYPLSEFCDDANLDDEDGCTRWCTVVR